MSNKGQILLGDKSERFSFRLDRITADQLHQMSREQAMPPSVFVRQMIRSTWNARQTAAGLVRDALAKTVKDLAKADAERAAEHDNK